MKQSFRSPAAPETNLTYAPRKLLEWQVGIFGELILRYAHAHKREQEMTYSPMPDDTPLTVKLARFVPGGPLPFLTVGTFDTLKAAKEAGRHALEAVQDEPETAGYLLLDSQGREVGNWTYWDELASPTGSVHKS